MKTRTNQRDDLRMALSQRCCNEVAKLLCESWVSKSYVWALLDAVPRDELVTMIYDYLIEMRHDSLELFVGFARVPYYFEQSISVHELSVSDILRLPVSRSNLKLQLVIHEFKNYEDAIALVDIPNVRDITILCSIDDLVMRFWVERLHALRGKKWSDLRVLRILRCDSAFQIYRLIDNIPSLEYLACRLDSGHLVQVPSLRQALTPIDHSMVPVIDHNIRLTITGANAITRRPRYNKPIENKSTTTEGYIYKVSPIAVPLPKPQGTPRPQKKPRLENTIAGSFFKFP